MLLDFEVVSDSDLDTSESGGTDICIVGAGAAGILLATQLKSCGLRVLLLEGGGLDLETRSQAIYDTELAGLAYRGATEGRFRTYGGTTTEWGGQILELEESDFERRDFVPGSGWPFPKNELKAFYERALLFEGLQVVERDDAKVWARLGLSICDLGPEFRMKYSRWCPERDFSVLHCDALVHSRNLRVLYHANVLGIILNGDKTNIEGLQVCNYSGRKAEIAAKQFILCTGAIEAVRLLLQPLPTGLAPWQANGLLGKHYQDHIALNRIPISRLTTQPASAYFGYAELEGFRYHNKILLGKEEQAKAMCLNVAATIGPYRRARPERNSAEVALRDIVRKRRSLTAMEGLKIASHLPGIVTERVSRRLFGDGAEWSKTMLTLHCEQSPLSASSITLAEDRDSIGLLKARLDWQISGHEIRTLRNYLRRAAEVFSSRRFAKIEAPKGFYEDDSLVISLCADSNHHMGGARMAVSSSQGIVDSNLKLHGISNGYLCSSAVFPCSGFSNPTHTMLALGMRLADHLRSNAEKIGTEVLTPSRTAGSMREVSLKHQGNRLPQLGFGCSYLLGPTVDRAKSLRLLEAAYDAGIRYFDTARLYGQGQCEPLLGEFLRRHPEARVGTKFGIEPPNRVQRAISAVGRRSAAFQRVATMVRGSGKVRFDAATAKASLERSMKELGREEVELFLLHEPERTELIHDDLLEFLLRQRELGRIGNFGIGGEYSRVPELYATRRAYTPVLQFEQSICGPAIHVPEAFRVHYRTFAKPAIALRNRFLADRKLAWWWSEMVGADLLEPQVLSSLLFRAELDTYPEALTLFSASAESHIYANVETSREQNLRDPAQRLKKLIHEDDLGIRAELYHQRESTSL